MRIPELSVPTPPQGDAGAVAEAARLLVEAENPVIAVGRTARTPAGVGMLVELAETLQAGVIDRHWRMNFPTRHPLSGGNATEADVILALEAGDISGMARQARQRNARVVNVSDTELYLTKLFSIFSIVCTSGMVGLKGIRVGSFRGILPDGAGRHRTPPTLTTGPV